MTVSVVRHKRGTSIQWASATYILKDGEIGIDKTLNKIKIGNGSSLWSDLPFVTIDPSELAELAQDAIDLALVAGTGITKTYNDVANTITLSVDSTIANKTYVDTAVSGLQSASVETYIPLSLLGQADGVAELDSDGVIPDSQIPAGITRDTELSSAVSTAINNLIDGAPAALDTLNELATAINDDSSYASTITTALGTKEPLLPAQTGNSGKFLTTDGTDKSWATISQYSLPTQTSNSGKFLTTNGSVESWATIPVTSDATPTSAGIVFAKTTSDAFPSTSLGFQSLNSLTTGQNNVGVGANSLYSNTTGSTNVAIGRDALYSNTSGAGNIAIGFNALKLNTLSQQNVAIGSGALRDFISTEVQGLNTVIGYETGRGITTGIKNTLIGAFAGKNFLDTDLTTGSNNILIGNNAATSSATVSNEITLGNSDITRFRIPSLAVDWSTTAYGRATYASTSAPSGGNNGDVWLVYTP